MKKSEFKNAIKECLLEILAEGLGNDVSENLNEARVSRPRKKKGRSRHPSLESVTFGAQEQDEPRRQLNDGHKKAINETIQMAVPGGGIMADIFADTAATTLQDQFQQGHNGASAGGAPRSNGGAGIDLSGMMGEASDNWSNLAFNE